MSVVKSSDYNILINEESVLLLNFIDRLKPSSIFVIVDENTALCCLPYFKEQFKRPFSSIRIAAGEQFKNLKSCTQIWHALMKNGCDRHSLIINLGGGVIGDMGGFVASSYMRGVRFIQIPTSLLSQVDASVGGKLGIDFLGYKNMIGLFNNPELVWIESRFLQTLPERELKSGLAEIIKHALIRSEEHWNDIRSIKEEFKDWPYDRIINKSIQIKNSIVLEDPKEKSIRKILNFGHTIGHAVESKWLETEEALLHGEAIAIGMICEAHLSYQKSLLTAEQLKQIASYLLSIYPAKPKLLDEKALLIKIMQKDKKNKKQKIMFSLLKGIGDCIFDQECSEEEIVSAFSYFENIQT